jgi:hypothetical protein
MDHFQIHLFVSAASEITSSTFEKSVGFPLLLLAQNLLYCFQIWDQKAPCLNTYT